jgi:hypothetical protein
MFMPTMGSVRPFSSPTTGRAYSARKSPTALVFSQPLFAVAKRPNQRLASRLSTRGEWESASVPPARISSASPFSIMRKPVSIDCMPEPQLIWTVKAGTSRPRRRAATRAGFISSAMTLTQPRMTRSIASGAKGWRSRSGRPHCTARSTGVKGPGSPRALMKGVRAPSTM